MEVGIRQGLGVAGLTLEMDRDPIAVARFDVAVDAVVGRVELAPDEPFGKRRLGPVQGLVEVGRPGDPLACLGRPEALIVGLRIGEHLRGPICLRRECGVWREGVVLMRQAFLGHVRSFVRRLDAYGRSQPSAVALGNRWGRLARRAGDSGRRAAPGISPGALAQRTFRGEPRPARVTRRT